ncbi:MAG: hypothetical protein JSS68_00500 [Actinobacteria bacterium]|nr:hypothetical protein [Actinomycetota bacterium]
MIGVATVAAAAALPTQAMAASPVLEFATPGFPVSFTAEGGPVTAVLADFDTTVHCAASRGEGAITGARSTLSTYDFTGCETEGGSKGGAKCGSAGANEKEIRSPLIEAELVFVDQATRAVGMLLDPHGGVYLSFECGGENVKALGPFLSPVGPINQSSSTFTASLGRLGATQVPSEYEGPAGERLQAIPTGEREGGTPGTTGVELSFTIHTSAPLTVRAVTAAEVEAKQRTEEAAARKREEEAAAARKRAEEEAKAREAAQRQEEELAAARRRARRLSKALKQCRKTKTGHRRVHCERRAKHRLGPKPAAYLR